MHRENFKPGVLPSPPDNRDFTIAMASRAMGESFKEELPHKFNHTYPYFILDQGNIGACVAYGLAAGKCVFEYEQLGKVIPFSPGYIYADRFGFHQGEGMIVRDALTALLKWGVVEYNDFPYIDTYDKLRPILWGDRGENLDKLRVKAYPFRISSFYRLDGDGQDVAYNIKKALVNGMLVATVFDVKESFWNIGKDGKVPIPKEGEKSYGHHLTLTLGYEDDESNTLNSWGEDWGNKGYCHFPLNYPFKEVWAMSDTIDATLVKLQQYFDDADKISPWAREAVLYAVENGFMQGSNRIFNPQGSFTREQAAVVEYMKTKNK